MYNVSCLSLQHKPVRYCMASNFGERERENIGQIDIK